MMQFNQEEGRYRVLLKSIGRHTESEKDSFCHRVSENYAIPFPLLKKIVDRCPIILKKNLSLKKAELLVKTLKSFGAMISIEEKRGAFPISLEFQQILPHHLALESSSLRQRVRGPWSVIGRVKNISEETSNDIWTFIQLFDHLDELIAFEETPLPVNPLPSGESSPFKIVFEGDPSLKKISIAFKKASGQPIPTVDKRNKKEWVEVMIGNGEENSFSPPPRLTEVEDKNRVIILVEPSEPLLPSEQEMASSSGEGIGESQEENEIPNLKEQVSLTLEPSEESAEYPLSLPEEGGHPEGDESELFGEEETFDKFAPALLPEGADETREEGTTLSELEFNCGKAENMESSYLDASVFEEATQILEDISEGPPKIANEEKLPSFPWIESFREVVETFEKPRDHFSIWHETFQKENKFHDSLHALLTILVHSRFDQGSPTFNALENTQRVFKLITQSNLPVDEIPSLEGNSFVSGDEWRDLFCRALPKIQQIGKAILEKNKWDAFDLERLIQVIPHMGQSNSRRAIRWMNELIHDVVEVDFSNIPILIGEGLYRVASRLGIVDPHFDSYQGRHSMGDIKIQNFAKAVFPQNPMMVEQPMDEMGSREEQSGHCFPVQPRCEGCLFETFCPKHYIQFNPSEKGMRGS